MNNYESLRQSRKQYCRPALDILEIAGCDGVVCTSPTGSMNDYDVDNFDWDSAGYDYYI